MKAVREKKEAGLWGLESGAIELGTGLSNRKYEFIVAGLREESQLGKEYSTR